MHRGLFITLEGGEGAGKTTQREHIKNFFEAKGLTVKVTREPGGTPLAEKIRELLVGFHDEPMVPKAELLLFFAARALHVENMILPALEQGHVVISDRFVDSTYAYQAAGRGLSVQSIALLESFTLDGLVPDKTFILDLDPAIGIKRATRRGDLDRFEVELIDFFNRLRQGFIDRIQTNPVQYALIDASKSEEDVRLDILPYLEGLYKATHLIQD